jgi:hypothetical protein
MTFIPTWLMVKRHKETGLMYLCKTISKDPNKYKGSGLRWSNHLRKHGRNVENLWSMLFTDKGDIQEFAIFVSEVCEIVHSNEWANLVVEDGVTGWPVGCKHTASSLTKMRNARLGKTTSEEQKKSVSKPVEIDGVVYESATEAANTLNIKKITLIKRINSNSNNFKNYKYINEKKYDIDFKKVNITINGILFKSIRQASITTGISKHNIVKRLLDDKNEDYTIIY